MKNLDVMGSPARVSPSGPLPPRVHLSYYSHDQGPGLAYHSSSFLLAPADARQLAAELLAAADKAEGVTAPAPGSSWLCRCGRWKGDEVLCRSCSGRAEGATATPPAPRASLPDTGGAGDGQANDQPSVAPGEQRGEIADSGVVSQGGPLPENRHVFGPDDKSRQPACICTVPSCPRHAGSAP